MSTVVISKVVPVHAYQGVFLISGTVDSNSWTALYKDQLLMPGETVPGNVASWFANDYYLFINGITMALAGKVITITVLDNQTVNGTFSGTLSSVYTQFGEYILFSVTIDNATCYAVFTKDEVLERLYAQLGTGAPSFPQEVVSRAYQNLQAVGSYLSPFVETFSGVVTSTSSTTSTTTSTTTTTTTTTTTASDMRLKENLKLLFMTAGIGVYSFNFIGETQRKVGVMAQEVYKVYPQAVIVGGEDPKIDPWKVDYLKLLYCVGHESAHRIAMAMWNQQHQTA